MTFFFFECVMQYVFCVFFYLSVGVLFFGT